MEKIVYILCGLWFWITRRRRVRVYSQAAATLELAHAHLLHDFSCHASTRDRGILLPQQSEALSILQNHAVSTYLTASSFDSIRECCRYVAEEYAHMTAVARTAPAGRVIQLQPRPATVRIRFALPASRFQAAARFLRAQSVGALWHRTTVAWRLRRPQPALSPAPAEQQLPLKAA